MPVYEARCLDCGADIEYTRRIADSSETPECPRCGGQMEKVILTAPKGFVKGKFEPFKSVVDGTIISCERDMREHNARNHVVNLADGYDDAAVKKGDFGKKESVLSKEELVDDIQESIYKVSLGYKPIIEGADDD